MWQYRSKKCQAPPGRWLASGFHQAKKRFKLGRKKVRSKTCKIPTFFHVKMVCSNYIKNSTNVSLFISPLRRHNTSHCYLETTSSTSLGKTWFVLPKITDERRFSSAGETPPSFISTRSLAVIKAQKQQQSTACFISKEVCRKWSLVREMLVTAMVTYQSCPLG
jgi:hypothetical protein